MDFRIRVCCSIVEIERRLYTILNEPIDFSIEGKGLDYVIYFHEASLDEKDAVLEGFADVYYGNGEENLAQTLVSLLYRNGLNIAVAESLTGGMICSSIIDVPGSSEVFYEGVVTYSNGAKIDRLNVGEDTLFEFGAVSEETAIEMANGLISDSVAMALSSTGIAGPSGGSETKPVGLVYLAIVSENATESHSYIFDGSRNEIREKAKDKALFLAIEHIRANYWTESNDEKTSRIILFYCI